MIISLIFGLIFKIEIKINIKIRESNHVLLPNQLARGMALSEGNLVGLSNMARSRSSSFTVINIVLDDWHTFYSDCRSGQCFF